MAGTDAAGHRLALRVARFVAARGVLRRGERALLLLSGGADSMALLDLLPAVDRRLGLGLHFAALHVDYAARGADSDRDRRLVERGCAQAGVPLHVHRLTQTLRGAGFQARARDLRYGRARELATEHGYDAVVTAHNRDDQAETVLYRLAKYATPGSLAGMRARDGELARPLLCLGAAEIREHCRARGLEFGEDVTNARPVYARNLLRLEVMPLLERVNPRVAETLAASADLAAAERDVLEAAAAAAARRVAARAEPGELAAVDLAALAAEPPALRALVLHDLVRAARGGDVLVERRTVDALLALAARPDNAGRARLGGGIEAVRGRGRLSVRALPATHDCTPAELDGAALKAAGEAGLAVGFCGRRFVVRALPGAALDRVAAARGEAFAGLPAPPRRVTLRHPRRGERFAPQGLGSETTAARFLAGARAPASRRAAAVALELDGRLAWLGFSGPGDTPAGRVAHGFEVHQSTGCTLHVREEDQ